MFGIQTLLSTLILAAVPASEDATLLFVTTPDNASCRQVAPLVREIAEMGYSVQVIDAVKDPELVHRLQVREFPTFLMLSHDRIVDRVADVGSGEPAIVKPRLLKMFDKVRPSPNDAELASLRNLTPPQAVFATPAPKTASSAEVRTVIATDSFPATPLPSHSMGHSSSATAQPIVPASFATPIVDTVAPYSEPTPSPVVSPWISSSVKLRVNAENAHSWGTGTIIDTREGSALILTCGHIFRDSRGQGKIEVQLFGQGSTTHVNGQCRYYDLEIDLALVVIEPPFPVRAIPLAPENYQLVRGLQVLSVGCDNGSDPTVRTHQILSTDRIGTPLANSVPFHYVQVSGAPVGGRSGGGLFAQEGYLIGVCNTADPVQNDGHFVPPSMIRRVLKQLDLAEVADRPSLVDTTRAPLAARTATESAPTTEFASPVATRFHASALEPLEPVRVPVSLDVPHATTSSPFPPLDPVQQATLEQLRNRSQDGDEIIVIVRSKKNPEKPFDFIVLNATPEQVFDSLARQDGTPQAPGFPLPTASSDSGLRNAPFSGSAH